MPTIEHAGAVLAYDDDGGHDLTPVVLLPGLSEARTTWSAVQAALAGRYRVLALDHRGHGDSSHAPGTYDLPHWGGDAIALCEQVLRQPAVLVGHSLGGVVSHHVAVERPDLVRGVFMEDPPLYLGDRDETGASVFPALFGLMQTVYRRMRDDGADLAAYIEVLQAAPAMNGAGTMAEVLGEDRTAAMAEALRALDPEIFTGAIDGTALLAARPDRALPCPVAVLRADGALGAAFTDAHQARFLATNPHARVTLVAGASHLIHDEQPDRFVEELELFLSGL